MIAAEFHPFHTADEGMVEAAAVAHRLVPFNVGDNHHYSSHAYVWDKAAFVQDKAAKTAAAQAVRDREAAEYQALRDLSRSRLEL